MNSISFAPPISLLPTWAIKSPSTNSGVRTFCLMSLKRSRFGCPRSNSFSIGTYSPSSNTSRASAPSVRPPTSMAWQVLANSPTSSPLRKMGVTTVKSLRWPEVSQGSLLIRLSPSCSRWTGYSFRKCRTARAMVLIWPGVPVTACASILPSGSKIPAERSPALRTTVVKEAFMRAVACSLTMEIKRFQKTSSKMGSIKPVRLGCMLGSSVKGSTWCRLRSYGTFFSSLLMEEQTAVDVVRLAGDEAGLLGGQEGDHIGDILGLGDPPQRRGLPRLFNDLGPQLFQWNSLFLGLGAFPVAQPVGVDRPRADGVHRNTVGRQVQGGGLGEPQHRKLGGGVGGAHGAGL